MSFYSEVPYHWLDSITVCFAVLFADGLAGPCAWGLARRSAISAADCSRFSVGFCLVPLLEEDAQVVVACVRDCGDFG